MPEENRHELPIRPGQLRSIAPLFVVEDVEEAAEYYRDKLGFDYEGFWGYPPCFTSVLRDGIEIMLKKGGDVEPGKVLPALKRRRSTGVSWDAYICVSDLDALYAELKKRRAKIIRKPEITEYDTREFAVEDCNGYVICFGQNLVSEQPEISEI